MSHGKMSDFVSIHLFRFTLLIKLRNFDFKSYWNFLIIFDKETVLLDLTMSDLWTLTVSSCVIRFRCLSHGLTVGSSFHRFTIFEWIFSQTHRFLKKKNKRTNEHRQHIPVLLKNAFLEWLTKTKQAVAVLYIWVGNYCSLS